MNDQPASRQFHDRIRIRIGRRRRGAGSPGRVAHPGLDELDFLGNALRRRRAVDGLGLRQLLHAADQVIAAPEDSDVALGSPGLDDRVRGHVGEAEDREYEDLPVQLCLDDVPDGDRRIEGLGDGRGNGLRPVGAVEAPLPAFGGVSPPFTWRP